MFNARNGFPPADDNLGPYPTGYTPPEGASNYQPPEGSATYRPPVLGSQEHPRFKRQAFTRSQLMAFGTQEEKPARKINEDEKPDNSGLQSAIAAAKARFRASGSIFKETIPLPPAVPDEEETMELPRAVIVVPAKQLNPDELPLTAEFGFPPAKKQHLTYGKHTQEKEAASKPEISTTTPAPTSTESAFVPVSTFRPAVEIEEETDEDVYVEPVREPFIRPKPSQLPKQKIVDSTESKPDVELSKPELPNQENQGGIGSLKRGFFRPVRLPFSKPIPELPKKKKPEVENEHDRESDVRTPRPALQRPVVPPTLPKKAQKQPTPEDYEEAEPQLPEVPPLRRVPQLPKKVHKEKPGSEHEIQPEKKSSPLQPKPPKHPSLPETNFVKNKNWVETQRTRPQHNVDKPSVTMEPPPQEVIEKPESFNAPKVSMEPPRYAPTYETDHKTPENEENPPSTFTPPTFTDSLETLANQVRFERPSYLLEPPRQHKLETRQRVFSRPSYLLEPPEVLPPKLFVTPPLFARPRSQLYPPKPDLRQITSAESYEDLADYEVNFSSNY